MRAAVLLAMIASIATARRPDPQRVLWQIGTLDHPSREFLERHRMEYADRSSDVVYLVGKSSEKGWLRFQPGPANRLADALLHPFSIDFHLNEPPNGNYFLRISWLYEMPRLSTSRIDVNGHAGEVGFSPKLDYAAGEWEGTFVPQTSYAQRSVPIAPTWLGRGGNVSMLPALDTPATPQSLLCDIAPGESGIIYDALALLNDPAQTSAKVLNLCAEGTGFYRGNETALSEVMPACAEGSGSEPLPRSISVSGATYKDSKPLFFGSDDFGECCTESDIPEWSRDRTIRLRAGGQATQVKLLAQKRSGPFWWYLTSISTLASDDYRQKVAELSSESIDGVLGLLPQHPEFRWTMDGSWIAQQYLDVRSPERLQQFLNSVQAGQIVVPPQFANEHTGVVSLEGLGHSCYYSHQLALADHILLRAANITDVPSYSWSCASVLHDAGIHFFAAASNSWHARGCSKTPRPY